MVQTVFHRLILPANANHKNTLFAGSLDLFALVAIGGVIAHESKPRSRHNLLQR